MRFIDAVDVSKWLWCRDHINQFSIWRSVEGESIPAKRKGEVYRWQFYLRRSLYDSSFQTYIGDLFFELLNPYYQNERFQIGSCETAGVSLGFAIQHAFMRNGIDLNHFSVRKDRKEYGLMNHTEGMVYNTPVVLVDDLAGSQVTLMRSKSILEASGVRIAPIYATLVDKNGSMYAPTHAQPYISENKLLSIYDLDDFELFGVARHPDDPFIQI